MLILKGIFGHSLSKVAANLHQDTSIEIPRSWLRELTFLKLNSKSFVNKYFKQEAYTYSSGASKDKYFIENTSLIYEKSIMCYLHFPVKQKSSGQAFYEAIIL